MLILLMVLFIVGNVLSAVAPVFGLMLVGRVVASLAHGAFFGIGSVVAADLVAPDKKASAISLMFTGLTSRPSSASRSAPTSATPRAGGSPSPS